VSVPFNVHAGDVILVTGDDGETMIATAVSDNTGHHDQPIAVHIGGDAVVATPCAVEGRPAGNASYGDYEWSGDGMRRVYWHDWGEEPMEVHCHHCNTQVTTTVTKVIGLGNTAGCMICCCLGGWYGCCLIPCCVDEFKDTIHSCPNCEQLLGRNGPFAMEDRTRNGHPLDQSINDAMMW